MALLHAHRQVRKQMVAAACFDPAVFWAPALFLALDYFSHSSSLSLSCCSFTGLVEAAGYAALIYCCLRSGSANIYGAYVAMQVCVVLSPNLLQVRRLSSPP